MSVELWFAATLIAAQLYDWRAGRAIQASLNGRELGWKMALACAAIIGGLGILFYRVDVLGVLNMMDVLKDRRAFIITLGVILSYEMCYLGLQRWFAASWWETAGRGMALILTTCFFTQPAFIPYPVVNNLLLLSFAIGMGCYVGRWASLSFAYLFYVLLMAYDVYACLYSNIMEKMIEHIGRIEVVPIGILVMSLVDFGIGAGDVIFGAMGAMIIRKHAGLKWSLAASILYVATLRFTGWPLVLASVRTFGVKNADYFPLMVMISPITIFCLWLGTRKAKPCG